MLKSVIVGMGEVGKALYDTLSPYYSIVAQDLGEIVVPSSCEVLHICLRYDNKFEATVKDYISRTHPLVVNICTTVPPGTTERVCGERGVHSTTRGLHPNLAEGLRKVTKHIGGPKAQQVADYFRMAGIPCEVEGKAATTELAHILNNVAYGVNLMLADQMQQVCRHYGVDYYRAVMRYTESNNEGFVALDQPTKVRMILTPPNGRIGGHCVDMSANLLPEEVRPPLIDMLAHYNAGPVSGPASERSRLREAQQRLAEVLLQYGFAGHPDGVKVVAALNKIQDVLGGYSG